MKTLQIAQTINDVIDPTFINASAAFVIFNAFIASSSITTTEGFLIK